MKKIYSYDEKNENLQASNVDTLAKMANTRNWGNAEQRVAIEEALSGKNLLLNIFGPPGTGKTETIRQILTIMLENKLSVRIVTLLDSAVPVPTVAV